MLNKIGIRTTEFWVCIGAILISTGVITIDDISNLAKSIGSLSTSIAAASYIISRGLAKKDVPMETTKPSE